MGCPSSPFSCFLGFGAKGLGFLPRALVGPAGPWKHWRGPWREPWKGLRGPGKGKRAWPRCGPGSSSSRALPRHARGVNFQKKWPPFIKEALPAAADGDKNQRLVAGGAPRKRMLRC